MSFYAFVEIILIGPDYNNESKQGHDRSFSTGPLMKTKQKMLALYENETKDAKELAEAFLRGLNTTTKVASAVSSQQCMPLKFHFEKGKA